MPCQDPMKRSFYPNFTTMLSGTGFTFSNYHDTGNLLPVSYLPKICSALSITLAKRPKLHASSMKCCSSIRYSVTSTSSSTTSIFNNTSKHPQYFFWRSLWYITPLLWRLVYLKYSPIPKGHISIKI